MKTFRSLSVNSLRISLFSNFGFSRFNWFIGQRLTVNLNFKLIFYLELLCRSQFFYFNIKFWKTLQDTNIGELRAQVLELSLNNNQLQKEVANSNEIIQSLRDKAEEDNATSVTEKTNLELTVKALSDKNSSLAETIRKQIEERLIFKR